MILVTGAAGKTGKAVVKALAASGARVRALVRRAESGAAVKVMGAAEVAIGSFQDSGALARAAAGARAIYHICPNVSRDELAFACAVVAAAQAQALLASFITRYCTRRSRRCRTTGRRCGSRRCCSPPGSR
jgi:NAD(P)H dehydrogenase (quinone)